MMEPQHVAFGTLRESSFGGSWASVSKVIGTLGTLIGVIRSYMHSYLLPYSYKVA